jgi:phosphatidylethanolamine-binding protein (PEBP) family uncharacterized protein
MRRRRVGVSSAVLLSAVALAGCGSSMPSVPKIDFNSAAMVRKTVPALYTCDGRDISPPLEWGAVPADVGSLVLFVVGYTPEPGSQKVGISVAWAVAGLNPALHKLAAGRLPRGTVVGLASNGERRYSICPKKGASVQYQFELYGLAPGVAVSDRFAGLPVLSLLTGRDSKATSAHGAFFAIYKRR